MLSIFCNENVACDEVTRRLAAADKARALGLAKHPSTQRLRDQAARIAEAHLHDAQAGVP